MAFTLARLGGFSLAARRSPAAAFLSCSAASRPTFSRRWWSDEAQKKEEAEGAQANASAESEKAADVPREGEHADAEALADAQERDKSPLETELEKVKEERDALREQALRAMAEAENTRRIAHRDVENAKHFGVEKFAKHVIKVNDNLRRALESVPSEALTEENSLLTELHRGVGMTKALLEKALGTQQIVEFNPAGEQFDPAQHAAMFTMPYDGKQEPGTVCQVLETGYMMRDRVLREAQVAVVKKEAPAELPKSE